MGVANLVFELEGATPQAAVVWEHIPGAPGVQEVVDQAVQRARGMP